MRHGSVIGGVSGIVLALSAHFIAIEGHAQTCSKGITRNVQCQIVKHPSDRAPINPEQQWQYPGGLPRGQYSPGVITSIPYVGTYNSMRYAGTPHEFGFGVGINVTGYVVRFRGDPGMFAAISTKGRRVRFYSEGNYSWSEDRAVGDLRRAEVTSGGTTITDLRSGTRIVFDQHAQNVPGSAPLQDILMPTKVFDSTGALVASFTYQDATSHILKTITDQFGNTTTFKTSGGVVVSATTAHNVVISFSYERKEGELLARLNAVIAPDPAIGNVWQGSWDENYPHLLTKFSLNGAVPSTTEFFYANPSGIMSSFSTSQKGKGQTTTTYKTTEDSVLATTDSSIGDGKSVFTYVKYADSPNGDARYPVEVYQGDGIRDAKSNLGVKQADIRLGYFGFPVEVTDMWGRTAVTRYVTEGGKCADRPTGITSPGGEIACISYANGEARFERNQVGNPTRVTTFDPSGAALAETTYEYDASGRNLEKVTIERDGEVTYTSTTSLNSVGLPLGMRYRAVERFSYDNLNNVTQHVSADGIVTNNEWAGSQLVRVTTDGVATDLYDQIASNGERTQEISSGGVVTTSKSSYDAWNIVGSMKPTNASVPTAFTSSFKKAIDGKSADKYTYTVNSTSLTQPTGKQQTLVSTQRPPVRKEKARSVTISAARSF